VSILKLEKGVATPIFSSAIITISLSIAMLGTAHAEQYCKSVDKEGNATYTRAPDQGCSSKKYKTVAIHRQISTPANVPAPLVPVPLVPAPLVAVTKSDIGGVNTTPSAEPAKIPVPPNAAAASPSSKTKLSQIEDK
jgi:hypothetical protein